MRAITLAAQLLPADRAVIVKSLAVLLTLRHFGRNLEREIIVLDEVGMIEQTSLHFQVRHFYLIKYK